MTAVFTGAGISGDPPASLPRGFGLRNDVLKTIHTVVEAFAPDLATADAYNELAASERKLEVVLGRLWGTIGDDALHCLLALQLTVPNEAHMLAAVHLAAGGTHVTLNFDIGIELAYDLLTSRTELPEDAPAEFHDRLPYWRALAPDEPPPLLVVAGHEEFDRWVATGRPPALLKVHGSLAADQQGLVDVVAVDIEELGQLHNARRVAVDSLATFDELLITGYSGGDPDVYEPLLTAAQQTCSTWRCVSLSAKSSVPADTADRGIGLTRGVPDGLASTALRELLGHPDVPTWPELEVAGPTYRSRFVAWESWLRARHPVTAFAQAWAWLVADLGDLDTGVAIVERLLSHGRDDAAVKLRHAELLYTRNAAGDRDRALAVYRELAAISDPARRNLCLLRIADISRGRAVRGEQNLLYAVPTSSEQ